MIRNICLLIVSVASLWLAPAYAESYCDAAAISPTLITPPPALTSGKHKNDITAILKLQQKPDAAELAKAVKERDLYAEMMLPSEWTRKDYPALFTLLDRTRECAAAVTKSAKNYFNTKRPYLTDTRIKALVDAHDNPSYPSGHTINTYAWAYVLGLAIPEKREQFLKRAEEIAQRRVLVGMHYRYDIEGGKELALLIMGAMSQSESFQRDLAAAEKEISIAQSNSQ